MTNKDFIRNIIMITLTFIIILLMITFLSFIFNLLKNKDDKYYVLGNDKIPSISSIVGERELYKYKSSDGDNYISKTYKYKNIKNPTSDITNYIDTLKNDYNYLYTSKIDLSKKEGKLQLGNNSVDSKKIIIVNITYDKDSYTITLTKGDGKINSYK